MSAISVAARVVRILWRGARAVRAVESGVEFSRGIVSQANELARELDAEGMSDREIAEELVRRRVTFRMAERQPRVEDFTQGPTETRDEHYADRGAVGGPTTGPTARTAPFRPRRRR